MFRALGKHHLLYLKKKETKKEANLSETQKRQLRKQIEAQKESGEKERTKIDDKTSQKYEKMGQVLLNTCSNIIWRSIDVVLTIIFTIREQELHF
jgi:hypothetical protein